MKPVSPIAIREAQMNDTARLVDFARRMALETEGKALDPDVVTRGIRAVFDHPARAQYFIAEHEGEAVGTLMLTYEWSDWRCANWWWIQSVFVIESARRLGVFRALYRHVELAARADPGVCGLRLYVERDNLRAQQTYQALGMSASHYRLFEIEFPTDGSGAS